LSFWLFKELHKKILKKILNALVIPRIFLICATVTLMDFRFVVLDMPIVVRVDEIVALRKNIQCYASFQQEKSLQKLRL